MFTSRREMALEPRAATTATRLRRLGAGIMIVVASIASVATTPSRPTLTAEEKGSPILLSPEHPSVAARFEFEANPAAFRRYQSLGVHVDYRTFWYGLAAKAPPQLEAELVKVSGPPLSPWNLQHLSCGAVPACVGVYELTFSWPKRLTSGSVRVEWTVSAEIGYSGSDTPRGGVVRVRLEHPRDRGDPPERFFEHRADVGGQEPIVAQEVRLKLSRALSPGTALALELQDLGESSERLGVSSEPLIVGFLLQRGRRAVDLPVQVAVPVQVPSGCFTSACSIPFELVVRLIRPEDGLGSGVLWALTATRPLDDIRVSVESRPIPILSEEAVFGLLRLRGDGVSRSLMARVRIPREALPLREFAPTDPVIRGQLWLNARADTLRFPENGQLEMQIRYPDGPRDPYKPYIVTATIYREYILSDVPESFIVPNRCQPGRSCTFRIHIELETRGFVGGVVDLEPSLGVRLAYPLTRSVPDRNLIKLKVVGT
jgi:hypothetical protein